MQRSDSSQRAMIPLILRQMHALLRSQRFLVFIDPHRVPVTSIDRSVVFHTVTNKQIRMLIQ
jgi:hypothetical protein